MPPSSALLGGFAIGARDALLWQHYGNAWKSPAVIRQAQRTPHALRTHAPAIKWTRLLRVRRYLQRGVPFRPYCAGVATRTRNVSEYMLVVALCLVSLSSETSCIYRRCSISDHHVAVYKSHRPVSPATLTPRRRRAP